MKDDFQFGLTQPFDCSYLPNQQERLIIATDPRLQNGESYQFLLEQGFRRSGSQIYRPHCENCTACQSLRIKAEDYIPSQNQKRLIKKNQQLRLAVSNEDKDSYFTLYQQYINTIHKDGAMFPATKEQYASFLKADVTNQAFIELWDGDLLVSVAVTDVSLDSLSAVYTFYHPDYRKTGLGMYSIIKQIGLCEQLNKSFLYLGYQIDECQKMNYKNRFFPHQRLIANCWKTINK